MGTKRWLVNWTETVSRVTQRKEGWFEYVMLTYCQSALLRASAHTISASSRGGRASRILFRILKSTIHGKGNVELSCRMSGGTSGGVVSRWNTAEDAEEESLPVIPPAPSVIWGPRECTTTEFGRERSSRDRESAVDEDISEIKVGGGRSGVVP